VIHFPSSAESLIEGERKSLARSWSQWFRDLWSSLGLSPSVLVYADLAISGAEMDMPGGITWTTVLGNIALPQFPAAADEGGMCVFRLPNNYRDGTPLRPWLEWCPADANAGEVDWRWEYLRLVKDTAPAVATTSLDETSTAPAAASQPTRVEFDDIDIDARKGDSLAVRLWRLGTGDTYASGAFLIACGLKYAIDGPGTTEVHP